MFCYDINKQQLSVLGLVDTIIKDFRLVVAKHRNTDTLKSFIARLIPGGYNIVIDRLNGYDWVDKQDSDYTRSKHIHGNLDFGNSPESTSISSPSELNLNLKSKLII